MAEQVIAVVTCGGADDYATCIADGHPVDTTDLDVDGYRDLFDKHGVTHVDSRLGLDDNLYGDLKDGLYDVDEWLEWMDVIK